jgi:hypothetical protein
MMTRTALTGLLASRSVSSYSHGGRMVSVEVGAASVRYGSVLATPGRLGRITHTARTGNWPRCIIHSLLRWPVNPRTLTDAKDVFGLAIFGLAGCAKFSACDNLTNCPGHLEGIRGILVPGRVLVPECWRSSVGRASDL